MKRDRDACVPTEKSVRNVGCICLTCIHLIGGMNSTLLQLEVDLDRVNQIAPNQSMNQILNEQLYKTPNLGSFYKIYCVHVYMYKCVWREGQYQCLPQSHSSLSFEAESITEPEVGQFG